MPTNLAGNAQCPGNNDDNTPAEKCVVKYISENVCKVAGGRWTRFITNYQERTAGVLSTCHGVGNMNLAGGIPYEPHATNNIFSFRSHQR